MIGKFSTTPDHKGRRVINLGDDLQYNVTDWRDKGASFTASTVDVWDGAEKHYRASLSVSEGVGTLRIGSITYAVTGWRKAGDGVVLFEAHDREWEAINEALGAKVEAG